MREPENEAELRAAVERQAQILHRIAVTLRGAECCATDHVTLPEEVERLRSALGEVTSRLEDLRLATVSSDDAARSAQAELARERADFEQRRKAGEEQVARLVAGSQRLGEQLHAERAEVRRLSRLIAAADDDKD